MLSSRSTAVKVISGFSKIPRPPWKLSKQLSVPLTSYPPRKSMTGSIKFDAAMRDPSLRSCSCLCLNSTHSDFRPTTNGGSHRISLKRSSASQGADLPSSRIYRSSKTSKYTSSRGRKVLILSMPSCPYPRLLPSTWMNSTFLRKERTRQTLRYNHGPRTS